MAFRAVRFAADGIVGDEAAATSGRLGAGEKPLAADGTGASAIFITARYRSQG